MSVNLGPWEPLGPQEMTSVLSGLEVPWWIAGGWALDLHLGRVTRAHEDLDVLILRPDAPTVREALADWDVQAVDPPGSLRPWPLGEPLPATVHDIWVRDADGGPWRFQLMVDDVVEGDWLYRRDHDVRMPVSDLAGSGPRVLRPDVQLLYKSKGRRPKDEIDFATLRPHLSADQRNWLVAALPTGHPWRTQLASG